jgi:hypothetical protein
MGSITEGFKAAGDSIMDAMKEKIKKNDESRKTSLILDTLESRIVQDAKSKGMADEEIAGLSKGLDGLRKVKDLSAAEAITIGKAIAPDIFQDEITRALKQANLTNSQNKPMEEAQKQFASIVEKNNPMKASSRSGLGMAANATQRADRALALLDNDVMTNQDLQGVVGDYAGILQGGAPTVVGMHEGEYKSAQQSLKGLAQYMSGNPQDAVPAKFKEHIRKNLIELKGTSDSYIKKNFDAIEKAYAPIISKFPDEWKNFRGEWDPKGDVSAPSASAPQITPEMALAELERRKKK